MMTADLCRSFVLFLGVIIASPGIRGEDEEKKTVEETGEKKPEILFQSGTESGRFKAVTGSWDYIEEDGKKIIRLKPEPVRECRVELGGTLRSYDITISAKMLGKEKARLKPRMGLGLFGEYGFFLRMAPGRKKLELAQYGEVIAECPLEWQSEAWTYIEFKMKAAENHWILEGRFWPAEATRPEKANLVHRAFPSTLTHPLSGRACLTGSPYNSLPILYDDVVVTKDGDSGQ